MIAVWETVPYRRAGAEEEEEADEEAGDDSAGTGAAASCHSLKLDR